MALLFIISLIGIIALLPVHFLSVEHTKLDASYGKDKGRRVGGYLGILSGWGYFLFLFGVWLSPQEQFSLPLFDDMGISLLDLFTISWIDILLGLTFILPGAWLGIKGVLDLGLKASETHRADEIMTNGIYSTIRHPQYLGAILSHIGITLLLSQFYALLVTPIIILRDFAACRKEERELIREFGETYQRYRKEVPMLLPRLKRRNTAMEEDQQ